MWSSKRVFVISYKFLFAGYIKVVQICVMSVRAVIAYVALGSNLLCPQKQIATAVEKISKLPQTKLVKVAPLYSSVYIGLGVQPDYVNTVVKLVTFLTPERLLHLLHMIEYSQGRQRLIHWGARILDLDLLLYGESVINTPLLVVPHARMCERNFVIYPLYDLSPDLQVPNNLGLIKDIRATCSNEGISLVFQFY